MKLHILSSNLCSAQPHADLQRLKKDLNEVKGRLSDKPLDVWHEHTAATNRTGHVVGHVRRVAGAELCTQAWCKFHELLAGGLPVLPPSALRRGGGRINSVHLCEAPGAFICSLNHYLLHPKQSDFKEKFSTTSAVLETPDFIFNSLDYKHLLCHSLS